MRKLTQHARILEALRQNKRGVENYKFARMGILSYPKRLSELRKEGHNIQKERVYLPNGRATGTFRYFLIEDSPKRRKLFNFK